MHVHRRCDRYQSLCHFTSATRSHHTIACSEGPVPVPEMNVLGHCHTAHVVLCDQEWMVENTSTCVGPSREGFLTIFCMDPDLKTDTSPLYVN